MKPEKLQRFAHNARVFDMEVQGTLHNGGTFEGPVEGVYDDSMVVWCEEIAYRAIDRIGFVFDEQEAA